MTITAAMVAPAIFSALMATFQTGQAASIAAVRRAAVADGLKLIPEMANPLKGA